MNMDYEGNDLTVAPGYLLTSSSTAEDFIKHFQHSYLHGESEIMLNHAYHIEVKVIVL